MDFVTPDSLKRCMNLIFIRPDEKEYKNRIDLMIDMSRKQVLSEKFIKMSDYVSNYFSLGIEKVGIKNLLWYFEKVMELAPNADIISVGSGNGVVEQIIDDKFKCDVICIDPFSNKFIPAPAEFVKPSTFDNVDDYLDKTPIISDKKLILFLNWPYNEFTKEDGSMTEYEYDYDSIVKLKPNHIIVVYDPSGSAGSHLLTNWMNKKCNVPIINSPFLKDVKKEDIKLSGYNYIGNTMHTGIETFCNSKIYARIMWLSRNPIDTVYDFPTI